MKQAWIHNYNRIPADVYKTRLTYWLQFKKLSNDHSKTAWVDFLGQHNGNLLTLLITYNALS